MIVHLFISIVLLFATGCESVKSTLGFDHEGPDEFNIVPLAPLSVPKDYQLQDNQERKNNDVQNKKQHEDAKEIIVENISTASTESFQAADILLGEKIEDNKKNNNIKIIKDKQNKETKCHKNYVEDSDNSNEESFHNDEDVHFETDNSIKNYDFIKNLNSSKIKVTKNSNEEELNEAQPIDDNQLVQSKTIADKKIVHKKVVKKKKPIRKNIKKRRIKRRVIKKQICSRNHKKIKRQNNRKLRKKRIVRRRLRTVVFD